MVIFIMTRLILKLKDSLKIEKLKDLKNRKCFSQMKKYYVKYKMPSFVRVSFSNRGNL